MAALYHPTVRLFLGSSPRPQVPPSPRPPPPGSRFVWRDGNDHGGSEMKLSELAGGYDEIAKSRNDPARARILAELFERLDAKTLAVVAHLTIGEPVHPQRSEALGIGPGLIRGTLAAVSGVTVEEIDA